MATFPSAAAQFAAEQRNQPSMLDQYTRALQLRALQQQQAMLPGQLQMQQQQLQQGQIQTQLAQQQLKDQESFRQAMSDPSMQGKTIGEVADVLAKSGRISAQSWMGLKKADMEYRSKTAELDDKQLTNFQKAHEQTQTLYNNVMNMPDQQLQQQWPSIVQQVKAIPGNQNLQLDPNQPMSKQQLQQFGPMVSMQNAYLDQETARREKQAEAMLKQKQAEAGGTSDSAQFVSNWLKTNGLPDTAPNRLKGQQEYIRQTKIVPAQVRVEGFGKIRMNQVYDSKTGQTIYMDSNSLNEANASEPGRYRAPGYTPEAIGQKSTTTYFTSGAGGKQLTAFNTAITHLDTLDRLAGDLNNTDIRIANRAKQEWASQTGNPAPANFEAAKNAMSGEVAAALKASGATDQEIAHVSSTFDRAQSPAQLKGAINTYRELLKSKAGQLQKQYNSGMQGKPAFQQQGQPGGGNVIRYKLVNGQLVPE